MKWAASLLLIAGLFSSAEADYRPLRLIELAGGSELIAAGTITEVGDDGTFTLRIDDAIFGPAKQGQSISVYQFSDWICAWRWSDYEVGQRVLVFIKCDRATERRKIRGTGSEGERPLVDED